MLSSARSAVYGWPSSLLNDSGGATTWSGRSTALRSTAAIRSLVDVLPDDPVTPMTCRPWSATSAVTDALASAASAASTSTFASWSVAGWCLARTAGAISSGRSPSIGAGAEHRDRTGGGRRRREGVAVDPLAAQRHEQRAGGDPPGVELDRPHHDCSAAPAGSGGADRRRDLRQGHRDHGRVPVGRGACGRALRWTGRSRSLGRVSRPTRGVTGTHASRRAPSARPATRPGRRTDARRRRSPGRVRGPCRR